MNHFHLLLFLLILIGCSNTPNKSEDKLFSKNSPDLTIHIPSQNRSPLMVSNDYGKSWNNASGNLPEDLQVSFIEPIGNELVIASDNKGIYISDSGRTLWNAIGNQLPNPKINALHLSNDIIYTGVYKSGIFESYDIGKTWMSLNENLPNLNVQAILECKNQLIIGTDIGIFILNRKSEKWISTSLKVQTLSIYAQNNYLIAGTSLGTALSKDGGQTWEWIRTDGAVHYTHPVGNPVGNPVGSNIEKTIIELALNGDIVFSDDWGQT